MDEIQPNLGRAVPLVSYANKKFIIDQEAEEILRNPIHKTIGIISLVGKYRTGKSFLLNRVLLNNSIKGFGVGPTIKPCTKGIWLWSDPLIMEDPSTQEKFSVFIIDTEGLGAYDEEVNHDTKIFLIAVLISSLFIFNSFGVIDENSISSLSFILNLSKTIKVSNSSLNDANELAKYFPSFFWLLRDFTLRLEDSDGNPISSKQYLENALKIQKGTSEMIEEKNKLRKLIMTFFPDRDCITLVRPIENENMLQQLMSINDSELRKEFLDQAKLFRNKVFKKVSPKMLNGKQLSGDMLIQLLSSILDSINQGSVPVIENSWKYVCEAECIKNLALLCDSFKIQLKKYKEKFSNTPTFFKDFEAFCKALIKETLEKFQKEALGNDVFEYEESLRVKLNVEMSKFNEENIKLYEQKLDSLLESNSEQLKKKLDINGYSKNPYEFFQDLDNFKENTESAIPDFNRKKGVVYNYVIDLVKKFIDITFVKTKQVSERETINLRSELTNTTNRLKIKVEEYENLKSDSSSKIEKLNDIIMEMKINDNMKTEKIKILEQEKLSFFGKNDNQASNIKKEYDQKMEKLNEEIAKLQYENKIKEDQISSYDLTNDKMSDFAKQKIELFENEMNSKNFQIEKMKFEIEGLKKSNEDLNIIINEMKVDLNKKKLLEYEIERLKKEINKSRNNEDPLNTSNNSSFIDNPNIKKQQENESKKMFDELLDALKASSEAIPKSISETLHKILLDKKNMSFKYHNLNYLVSDKNTESNKRICLPNDLSINYEKERLIELRKSYSGRVETILKNPLQRKSLTHDLSPDLKPNNDLLSLSPIDKRISNANNLLTTSNNNLIYLIDKNDNNVLLKNIKPSNIEREDVSVDKVIFEGYKNALENSDIGLSKLDLSKSYPKPDMDIDIKPPRFSIGKLSKNLNNKQVSDKENFIGKESEEKGDNFQKDFNISQDNETEHLKPPKQVSDKENFVGKDSEKKGDNFQKDFKISQDNETKQLKPPIEERNAGSEKNSVNFKKIMKKVHSNINEVDIITHDKENISGKSAEILKSNKRLDNQEIKKDKEIEFKNDGIISSKIIDEMNYSINIDDHPSKIVELFEKNKENFPMKNANEARESIYSPESFRDKNFIVNPIVPIINSFPSEQGETKQNFKRNPSIKDKKTPNRLIINNLQSSDETINFHKSNEKDVSIKDDDLEYSKSTEKARSKLKNFDDLNIEGSPDENKTKDKNSIDKFDKDSINKEGFYTKREKNDEKNENSNQNKEIRVPKMTKKKSDENILINNPNDSKINNLAKNINRNNRFDSKKLEVNVNYKNQELKKDDISNNGKKEARINLSDKISNIDKSPKNINDSINSNMFSSSPNDQNVNYREIITSNKTLATALQSSENRIQKLEEKINSLKEIKSIVNNNSISIQCKICKKYYEYEAFKKHFEICEADISKQTNENRELKIKILKGLLKKDEVAKPYIEYIIDVEYNHQNWRVSRKFNQFTSLHIYLKTNYPNNKFPESSRLFSKFDSTHENKLILLEKYLKEITCIQEIKKSKMFIKFFGLDENADIDFDAEINNQRRITDSKAKVEDIVMHNNTTKEFRLKENISDENKNLVIDMNKINNYNYQEQESDGRDSKKKNKNLSFY